MSEKVETVLKKITGKIVDRYVPLSIIIAEELSTELSETLKEAIKTKHLKTLTSEVLDLEIDGTKSIASYVGEGKVREVALIFSSPNVRVYMFVDDFDRLPSHKNLLELIDLSPKLAYLSVFQDEKENYVVYVKDISFLKSFKVYVNSTEKVKLKRAFTIIDMVS